MGEARSRVLLTLRSLAGLTPGFDMPRSPQGFFVHFLDKDTGAAQDTSSCMMCTGLLMSGVLFSVSYFQEADPHSPATAQVVQLGQQLWNTTQFERLLCDQSQRESFNGTGIPMLQLFNGTCQATQFPQPDGYYDFNEVIRRRRRRRKRRRRRRERERERERD